MSYLDVLGIVLRDRASEIWHWGLNSGPRPCVTKPQLRNDMERSGFWTAIVTSDPYVEAVGVIFIFRVLQSMVQNESP